MVVWTIHSIRPTGQIIGSSHSLPNLTGKSCLRVFSRDSLTASPHSYAATLPGLTQMELWTRASIPEMEPHRSWIIQALEFLPWQYSPTKRSWLAVGSTDSTDQRAPIPL